MLHIQKEYSDNYFDTFSVEGLSVDEMNQVLNAQHEGKDQKDVLVEVMNKHDNDTSYGRNIASGWRCGYGIYSINHVGGYLFVRVGNSCD